MRNMVKRTAAGAVVGASLLATGGLGIASAAPVNDVNDQLVDLSVGNTNILRDLNVDVAAQIAGLLCGTGTGASGTAATGTNANNPAATGMAENETTPTTGDLATVARQVDAGQVPTATCNSSSQGVVTISQNGPANSPNAAGAPGQSNPANAPGQQQPGAATPTTTPSPAPGGMLAPAPNS